MSHEQDTPTKLTDQNDIKVITTNIHILELPRGVQKDWSPVGASLGSFSIICHDTKRKST